MQNWCNLDKRGNKDTIRNLQIDEEVKVNVTKKILADGEVVSNTTNCSSNFNLFHFWANQFMTEGGRKILQKNILESHQMTESIY